MLIPDWLFVLLAVFSITLLLILLTCLVCAILARKRHQAKRSSLKGQKKGNRKPEFSFSAYDEPRYTYLPYTTAYTVQGSPHHHSTSLPGSISSDAPLYTPVTNPLPVTRKKVDALDRLLDERLQQRSYPDAKRLPYSTSHLEQLVPSRASSRRSSLGSVHSFQPDDGQPQKSVYLHSALSHPSMNGETDKNIIVSYDQETADGRELRGNGRLKFSLFYDPIRTELVVTIKAVSDLPEEEGKDLLNPYVNFCIVPEDFYWQQTAIAENTLDPIFNETFHISDVLHHKLREYSVCFIVMHADRVHGDRAIGKVMVSLSDLRAGVDIEMAKEISN